MANSALVEGIPLCGWHSRNHGALHTEQASLRGESPAQGPQFSLGGRTKDLWKSGLPRPHGQGNSVLREEFRGLIVARTFFFFLGHAKGGQSKIVLFLYKDNRRSQRLGATLFLSYSSFFMISCRGEQRKKRGPSQQKEKDLQRQRLLTLFLFLAVCYESGKPGILNMRDSSK